jgi:RNA polymerase sigma-70 factor (ECF subfamily)
MAAAVETLTPEIGFASTRWTIVQQAADSQTASEHSLSALTELCRIYWRPIYAFLRRQGVAPHDAQDFTQGFFAELIESRAYTRADPLKGRFRSFLLGALKHFVGHQRERDQAQKRGGGVLPLQLDEQAVAEADMYAANYQKWSADGVFEREWAAALLRHALDRLGQEYMVAGKFLLFESLKVHLTGGQTAVVPYEQMAKRLGRPAVTLRSDVARLRARYRVILREEVGGTVIDPADVDEELRHLRQAMAT